MKIVSRNTNSIVVKDWALSSYFLGPVIFCAGIFWGYGRFTQGFNTFTVDNLVAIIFAIVGLYILFSQEITTITLDKVAENISILRKTFFSSKIENYRFSDLAQIILEEKISRSSKGGSAVSYDIQLFLKEGAKVSLVNKQTKLASFLANKKKYVAITKELSEFIGVGFKDFGTPSLGDALDLFKQVMTNKNTNNNLDNSSEK